MHKQREKGTNNIMIEPPGHGSTARRKKKHHAHAQRHCHLRLNKKEAEVNKSSHLEHYVGRQYLHTKVQTTTPQTSRKHSLLWFVCVHFGCTYQTLIFHKQF